MDDVSHLTGNFCTIFERMNDAGDMLRVNTSVLKTDGTRAVGTFIPAKNPDGTANAVIKTVLGGQTYRGRAFVVNDWHAAAYEPIWDPAHARVIGMLYVGVPLTAINKDLHDIILKMTVGKTGYVYALGAGGDQRGHYLVSAAGKRDGENIWEAKDASGRLFIQSIVAKALATHDGESDYEIYSWKNDGETTARIKFAAVTYYAPWDWVIGAGAYEDDFNEVRGNIENTQNSLLRWVALVGGVGALLASVAGVVISRGISRPIIRVIGDLGDDQVAGRIISASKCYRFLRLFRIECLDRIFDQVNENALYLLAVDHRGRKPGFEFGSYPYAVIPTVVQRRCEMDRFVEVALFESGVR
mgnify:CR=1 FL=1